MGLKYYLGAPGSWDYADAQDVGGRIHFPGPEALEQSADGSSAATGRVELEDEFGAFRPRAWWPFWVDEDDCDPPRVWTGLLYNHHYTRQSASGLIVTTGRIVQLDLVDLNTLLKFTPILLADGAKRPAETVGERIAWLLDGVLADTVFDTGFVNVDLFSTGMDEADFSKQYAVDVLQSICALTASDFYVIWDDDDAVPSLVYEHQEQTQRSSTVSIDNVRANFDKDLHLNGLVRGPSEDSVLDRLGEDVFDAVAYTWRGGEIYQTSSSTEATFFGDFPDRGLVAGSDRVGKATTASAQVIALLDAHSTETDSITTSIWVPADLVNKVQIGMAINAKYTHFGGTPDYSQTTEWKIMRRGVREVAHGGGSRKDLYLLTLRLERGIRAKAVGGGNPGELPHEPPETGACVPSDTEIQLSGTTFSWWTKTGSGSIITGAAYMKDGGYGPGYGSGPAEATSVAFYADSGVTHYEGVGLSFATPKNITHFNMYAAPGAANFRSPDLIKYGTGSVPVDQTTGTPQTFSTSTDYGNADLVQNGGTIVGHESSDGFRVFTLDATATAIDWIEFVWVTVFPGGGGVHDDFQFTELGFYECVATTADDNPPNTGQTEPWAPAASVTINATTTSATTVFPYAAGSLHVKVDGIPIDPSHIDETDPGAGEYELDWAIDTDETVTDSYQGI